MPYKSSIGQSILSTETLLQYTALTSHVQGNVGSLLHVVSKAQIKILGYHSSNYEDDCLLVCFSK